MVGHRLSSLVVPGVPGWWLQCVCGLSGAANSTFPARFGLWQRSLRKSGLDEKPALFGKYPCIPPDIFLLIRA
jgi:hypothetical protein